MTHVRGHLLEHTEVEREVAAVLVVERHLVYHSVLHWGKARFPGRGAGAPFPEAACARHEINAIRNPARNDLD